MPPEEIDPSVMRSVFEGVEKYAPKYIGELKGQLSKSPIAGSVLNPMIDKTTSFASWFAHKTLGFNNITTGESGKAIRDLEGAYFKSYNNHLAEITAKHEQAGIKGLVGDGVRERQARAIARTEVMLPNDARIISRLKAIKQEHGPMKAAMIADALQVHLEDVSYIPSKFKTVGGITTKEKDYGTLTSKLYSNIMRDKNLRVIGELPKHKLVAAKEEKEQELTGFTKFGHFMLAPKTSIKHLSQYVGLLSNPTSLAQLVHTGGAIFGPGYRNAQAELLYYNAYGEWSSQAHSDLYHFNNSITKKFAPNSFGEFLVKNYTTPGFRGVRNHLIVAAAAQGKFVAQEAAHKILLDRMDRTAQVDLRYLGIDYRKVISNAGLEEEDIRSAMYENIRQRAFSNNPMYRARWALTPIGRVSTVYHFVAQNQKRFFSREIMRALQTRNPMRIAGTAAALGLAYPGSVWAIHHLVNVLIGRRTPSEELTAMEHPIDTALTDAHELVGDIQVLADVTGYGVAYSYANAASKRKIAEQALGAHIGMIVNLIDDAAAGATGRMEGHNRALWPLYRDILDDTVPFGIGMYLGHKLYPTREEEKRQEPMTPARQRAARSAQRRKLRGK